MEVAKLRDKFEVGSRSQVRLNILVANFLCCLHAQDNDAANKGMMCNLHIMFA